MGLDERQVIEPQPRACERALPCVRTALELQNVALGERQEILHVLGGAEDHRLVHGERGVDVGEHQRGGAVRHRRAIGALERAGHERILLALGAAELVTEILAHLGERIADPVAMVLCGDPGERVGLVAVLLEIEPGDLAKDSRKAARDIRLVAHIGCFEQVAADLGGRGRGHLLDSDDKHDTGRFGGDRVDPLVHGGRTGGARVLDPGRPFESQVRVGLQHQRRGKVLCGKARIEMAEHDLVDVPSADACVGQRLPGYPHDQALDRLGIELAERCVGPSDDTGGHGALLCRILVAFLGPLGGAAAAGGADVPSLRSLGIAIR